MTNKSQNYNGTGLREAVMYETLLILPFALEVFPPTPNCRCTAVRPPGRKLPGGADRQTHEKSNAFYRDMKLFDSVTTVFFRTAQ